MQSADSVRIRRLAAGAGLMACLLMNSACGKLEAQQSAADTPKACTATVTVLGHENSCPSAPIRFHVSVSGCQHSTGTFAYDFMAVDEAHKIQTHKSASWISAQKEWDQTEQVPLACSAEIYVLSTEDGTSCACAGP